MKKAIALLFVLALLLNCAAGLAEAAETTILFRGIPWGTSLAEIQREGLPLQTPYHSPSISSIAYRMYGGEKKDYYSGDVAVNVMYTSEGLSQIKVAGYTVDRIVFNFAYVPVDGKLVDNYENTALYCALYMFAPSNYNEVLEDLANKLTLLYGDVDLTTNGYRVWYGAEGTMASLYLDGSEIYLKYSFAGGEDLLIAAQDAKDGKSGVSPTDTEGL